MPHPAHSLIGKTINKIVVSEVDFNGDRHRVHEVLRITFSDGNIIHLICDGGDGPQFSTLNTLSDDNLNSMKTGEAKFLKDWEDSSIDL